MAESIPPLESSLSMPSHFAYARSASPATLGQGDIIGQGDSSLVLNLMPQDRVDTIFDELREEVDWQVCCAYSCLNLNTSLCPTGYVSPRRRGSKTSSRTRCRR